MKKKKTFSWAMLLLMAGSLILGGFCGMMIVDVALQQKLNFGSYMLTVLGLILGLYVILFAHVAIHEAGHLIFGLLTGYGFSSFRLGSFMLLQENGKLRLRRLSLPGTGGQCLMTPPELVDGKLPYLLYNLGGCIMNLAVSAVALLLWALLPKDTVLSVLLMMAVVFGLVLALSNGIPARMGSVDNDGCNALTLAKHPETMKAFWLQLKVNEQLSKGVRLKDMPEAWFAEPENADNGLNAVSAVFTVNRLMDEHRFEEARSKQEALLAGDNALSELHRSLVTCDLLYCELIGENRPEVREQLMTKEQKKYMQAMKKSITVLRTEYVLALLGERDQEKAASRLEQFTKRAKTYPYPCEVESEQELIELAEQVMHSA